MASVKQFQVTFDCAEPERVAHFWCEVLAYVVRMSRVPWNFGGGLLIVRPR